MILEGAIRIPFEYAAGTIGSRFLVALRDCEVILGAVCESCARIGCPPQSFCAACGRAIHELREVGPAGTVEASTEVSGKGVFGLIRLDGADTALVHKLLGPPARWGPGVRVTARFVEERVGSIDDIEGFEFDGGAS